jgi:hypothetical protein
MEYLIYNPSRFFFLALAYEAKMSATSYTWPIGTTGNEKPIRNIWGHVNYIAGSCAEEPHTSGTRERQEAPIKLPWLKKAAKFPFLV